MIGPLGAIADDLTGGIDLASTLVSRGFRTRLHVGVPSPVPATVPTGYDAHVVALKTRTALPDKARQDSALALQALIGIGCARFYIKYCSTFDSTSEGNIGPVCDVVMERLGVASAVVVPSFPANGRTLYRGHLFVGSELLSESSLADHPLTPMTDSCIPRVLQAQTSSPVSRIDLSVVRGGSMAVRRELDALTAAGARYVVVDAIDDTDLCTIADATAGDAIITGGSGLATGMRGSAAPGTAAAPTPPSVRSGPGIVLAGSVSAATRGQLATAGAAGMPLWPLDLADMSASAEAAVAWALQIWTQDPAANLIIAPQQGTEPPEARSPSGHRQAEAIESCLAELARRFVAVGVRRLIVAGGETSGAIVSHIGARDLLVGAPIGPGLAWSFTQVPGPSSTSHLALALKSGNFGEPDFFLTAWVALQ